MSRSCVRTAAALAAAVAIALLGGCSQDQPSDVSKETVSSATSGANDATPSDPNDVPEDDTDYTDDAGNDMKEYEYPDDPTPADSSVATLCNLSQAYLSGLRTVEAGAPIVDNDLRTNLVGFSDLLTEWEGLRPHFPEAEADIATAKELYAKWDLAVLSVDNGDTVAANDAMLEAEKILTRLPEDVGPDCIE